MIVIIPNSALQLPVEWISKYKNEILDDCVLSQNISKKLKEK